MAMKDLISGECGGANPLMKITQHVNQDLAFRDRAVANRNQDSFQRPSQAVGQPHTFNMQDLLQQAKQLEPKPQRVGMQGRPTGLEWEKELHPLQPAVFKENVRDNADWERNPLMQDRMHHNGWGHGFRPPFSGPIFRPAPEPRIQVLDDNTATKEWSIEYNAEQSELTELEKAANEMVDAHSNDEKISKTDFFNYVSELGTRGAKEDNWTKEYGDNESQILRDPLQRVTKITEEYNDMLGESRTSPADPKYWEKLEEEWQSVLNTDEETHPWLDSSETSSSLTEEYSFEEKNPFADVDNPFEEGLKLLKLGEIPNAALLFEAAVRKDAKHEEAWYYLGATQSQNEQEDQAICAFQKCLFLNPDHRDALISLAVAFTNESMPRDACNLLKRWIKAHPAYRHLRGDATSREHEPSGKSFWGSRVTESDIYREVQDLYINAARMNLDDPDPDVQCGLGVLYNLSGHYDRAIDCFRCAVSLKPNDPLLWNKLGATLANASRPEEAINSYRKSLELHPGYIRARYNLGISCMNLNAYREGIQHFLTTLNMQQSSNRADGKQGETSQSIWSSLRMAASYMKHDEAYRAAEQRDLIGLNRIFNIDEAGSGVAHDRVGAVGQ